MDDFKKENEENTTQQDPFNEHRNVHYNRQEIPQQGSVPPQYQQYNPYQQQYPYQAYQNQYGYPRPYSSGMAIASLVIGIVSIVFAYITAALPFLFIVPIIGIVLGAVHKSRHLPVGKGLSTAGIVTSSIGIVLAIGFYVLIFVLAFFYMPEMLEFIKTYSPEDYQELYDSFGEQYPEWFTPEAIKFFLKI